MSYHDIRNLKLVILLSILLMAQNANSFNNDHNDFDFILEGKISHMHGRHDCYYVNLSLFKLFLSMNWETAQDHLKFG